MSEAVTLLELLKKSSPSLPEDILKALEPKDVILPHMPTQENFTTRLLEEIRKYNPDALIKEGNVGKLARAYEKSKLAVATEKFGWKNARRSQISEEWGLFNYMGVFGRRGATEETDRKLLRLVREAVHETGAKMPDKITILESDDPIVFGSGKITRNGQSELAISSDLLRTHDPLELKAIIGHELSEIAFDSKYAGFASALESVPTRLGIPHFAKKREFRADLHGAKTEGGSVAMASSQKKIDARMDEITQFARGLRTFIVALVDELAPEHTERFAKRLIPNEKSPSKVMATVKNVVFAGARRGNLEGVVTHPETAQRIEKLLQPTLKNETGR